MASVVAAWPAATASAEIAPRSVIRTYMSWTFETGPGASNFRPIGARHTISDGVGGTITAQLGLRQGSADGKGYVLFFFRNSRFVGWDSGHESLAVGELLVEGDRFALTYQVYASSDPLCCPSGGPVTVHYRWAGSRIKPSRPIPRGARGSRITLRKPAHAA